MAITLQSEILSHSGHHCGSERRQYQIKPARISDYESGKREPDFFVMIAYTRLGQVHLESVVDDAVTVNTFRKRLGKESFYVMSRPTNKRETSL